MSWVVAGSSPSKTLAFSSSKSAWAYSARCACAARACAFLDVRGVFGGTVFLGVRGVDGAVRGALSFASGPGIGPVSIRVSLEEVGRLGVPSSSGCETIFFLPPTKGLFSPELASARTRLIGRRALFGSFLSYRHSHKHLNDKTK